MNCTDVRDNLSAFLDGELDRESASQVRAHLAECEACRAELESLRGVVDTLHALPRRPAPSEIEREIVSLLERDALLTRPVEPKRRPFFFTALGGATVAAAGLLVAAGVYLAYLRDADRSDETTVAMNSDIPSPSNNYDLKARAPGKDYETPGGVGREYGGDGYKWADKRTEAAPRDAQGPSTAPAAPEMKQKDVLGDVAQGPDFRPSPAPAVDTEVARMDRKDIPAPATTPPTKGIGGLEDEARKVAEEYRPEPPRPEVLELQFAASDLDAARTRITALADSLNIRTVRAARLGYMAETEGAAVERMARSEAGERDKRDTAADLDAARSRITALADSLNIRTVRDALNKIAQNSRTDGEYESAVARLLDLIEKPNADADGLSTIAAGAPVVVLAVPEDKLPQLVAKLAADQSGVEGGKLASAVRAVPSQTPAGGKAEAEKTGTQQKAPDPLDKFMKALDEAAKEDAERERMAQDTAGREGEPGRVRRPRVSTPVPSVREGKEAPKPADETILAEAVKKDSKTARPARLVYLQIYLSKVSRTAEAAKTNAETAPAAK